MIQQFITFQSNTTEKEIKRMGKLNSKINGKFDKKEQVTMNIQPQPKTAMLDFIYFMKMKKINQNVLLFENIYSTENPNFNTIYFIYQYQYSNNVAVTGFGDFIRGCYFLLQFCDKYNLKYVISINHPLKKYLTYFDTNKNTNDINTCYFTETNATYICNNNNQIDYQYIDIDTKLIQFLNHQNQNHNDMVNIYFTNHPNYIDITELHKHVIREIFSPTECIIHQVNTMLDTLHLTKKAFKVIHIRILDSVFETDSGFNIDLSKIQQLLIHNNNNVLLVSNSNNMKKYLIKMFPTLKTNICQVGHMCNEQISDQMLVNTLTEFYIMSQSNYIYSFSMYKHGSGFSKWSAYTYNIPYICYYLE